MQYEAQVFMMVRCKKLRQETPQPKIAIKGWGVSCEENKYTSIDSSFDIIYLEGL